MNFCDEELDFGTLFSDFENIYDKYQSIEDISPLQGVAIAIEISDAIDNFKQKITTITFKGIICKVISNIDIDDYSNQVQDFINQINDGFNNLDNEFTQNYEDKTIDEIEAIFEPLINDFITTKEELEKAIDEKLSDLFSPLIKLGATKESIDEALKDIEFQDSPTQYLIDVFTRIVQDTLNTI